MFLGIDTALFFYLALAHADGHLAEHVRSHEAPNYAALAEAHEALKRTGVSPDDVTALGIVDFTKPSYLPRLEIHRPGRCRAERFLCAHGKNTGDIYATSFSNRPGSFQTSLGLYRVGKTYRGQWGKSVELHGLQPGLNDKAHERRIVLHGAWYAAEDVVALNLAEGYGARLGRSQGCPAVCHTQLPRVLELLPTGSFLYIHGHSQPPGP